jgi:tetratricopeptide (TPR) repeat protein
MKRFDLQHLIGGREERYDLYCSLGWIHEQTGEYALAADWFGRAFQIAQTMESPSMLLESMVGRLAVWDHWDRWREALEVAQAIQQTSEQYQLGDQWLWSTMVILAELKYRIGETEASEKLLKQYRLFYGKNSTYSPLLPGIYAAHGDWVRALADEKILLTRSEPFPAPGLLAHYAESSVLALEPSEVQATVCARAVEVSETSGAKRPQGISLRARGRHYIQLTEFAAAESDLRAALNIFESLDLPWEQGETLATLGQLYQQRIQSATQDEITPYLGLARFFYEQALGYFASLHAVHDEVRVKTALENLTDSVAH